MTEKYTPETGLLSESWDGKFPPSRTSNYHRNPDPLLHPQRAVVCTAQGAKQLWQGPPVTRNSWKNVIHSSKWLSTLLVPTAFKLEHNQKFY